MQDVSPLDHIGRLSAPVFITTGTEDQQAPPTEAQRLLECCRGSRQLWLVPQATHHDVFDRGGREYQERVLAFLERHLHEAGASPATANLSSRGRT
jgi:pimeloyl-ACP methyl ester carboxylesterase